MTIFCVLLSPLLAWWQQRTNSLLAPVFLHGALNATGGLMLFVSGSSLLVGITGFAGLLVLAAANLGLFWYEKKRQPLLSATAVEAN